MRRAFIALVLSAAAGCGTVDLTYVDSGAGAQPVASHDDAATDAQADGADGSAPRDAGPVNVVDGDAVGANGACGCDQVAGIGCCIPAAGAAAFCTDTADACLAQGGVFVGCHADDPTTESVCCWKDGVGPRASTALTTACASRPHACTTDAECGQARCETAKCGGVTVGACGVAPTCP